MPKTENREDLDDEIAAALADNDRDDDDEQETDDNGEEEDAPVEVAAATPLADPPAKRGKKKKELSGAAKRKLRAATPEIEASRPQADNLVDYFNQIVEKATAMGYGGASGIRISVKSFGLGPNKAEPKTWKPIDGEMVAGTTTTTPGEDLQDCLTRVYHCGLKMPSTKWNLDFYAKHFSASHMGHFSITLDDHMTIREQWKVEAEWERERQRTADFSGAGRLDGPTHRVVAGNPTQYGQPQQLPAVPIALPQMPPPAGTDPAVWAMMQSQMQWMQQQYDRERREAMRLGMAPPAPPPGVPIAAPTQAEQDARLAQIVAQTVQGLLTAHGIIPTPGQPPINERLSPEAVARDISSPRSAAKTFFQEMREFKLMEKEMQEMFAPEETGEEDPPPAAAAPTVLADDPDAVKPLFPGGPLWRKKKEGETMLDHAMQLGLANPEIAGKVGGKVLETAAKMVGEGTIGKLVDRFVTSGGPQAAMSMLGAGQTPPGASEAPPPAAHGTNGQTWKPKLS